MIESKAAGPKTELVGVSGRMQQSIENMIEFLAAGVGDCMDFARNAKPQNPYDRERSSERDDAAKMVTTTAELLSSIAKLKGEFRHNYHVTRVNEGGGPTTPKPDPYWNGDETQLLNREEYDALSMQEQVDYERWTNGLPPRFAGWKRPSCASSKPKADDSLKQLEEEIGRVEKMVSGTPHPEN